MANSTKANVAKGTTKSGFNFAIDKEVLDDMELIEMLADEANGDITLLPAICESVLGEKQKKTLYEHVREKNGKVKISVIEKELVEMFKLLKAKN